MFRRHLVNLKINQLDFANVIFTFYLKPNDNNYLRAVACEFKG